MLGALLYLFIVEFTHSFVVYSPSNVSGSYEFARASFSPLPTTSFRTRIVLADPITACVPLNNNVSGSIVLVRRGVCTFFTKAMVAQAAGAVGVVVGDSKDSSLIVLMTAGECDMAKIVSVSIKKKAMDALEVLLKQSPSMVVSGGFVLPECAQQNGMVNLAQSLGLDHVWTGPNACLWRGVTCDNDGNVIRMNTYESCATSSIRSTLQFPVLPKNLCAVSTLSEFEIQGIGLAGSLPDITNCTKLLRFYVYLGSVSGTIPESFTNHPSLQYFDASNNVLSGTIPTIRSKSLQHLLLSKNKLSGEIIGQFVPNATAQLVQIRVDGNRDLKGTLSPILLQTITVLDISDTNLSIPVFKNASSESWGMNLSVIRASRSGCREIPLWIANLPQLTVIAWQGNHLNSSGIPSLLGIPLVDIDLSDNNISMDVMALRRLFPLARKTEYNADNIGGPFERLSASNNHIYGPISIATFPGKTVLDDNDIVAITFSYSTFTSESLSLRNNKVRRLDWTAWIGTDSMSNLDLRGNPITTLLEGEPYAVQSAYDVNLTLQMQCPSIQKFRRYPVTALLPFAAHGFDKCECLSGFRPEITTTTTSVGAARTMVCVECPEGVSCPRNNLVIVNVGRWASPNSLKPKITYECTSQGHIELCNPDNAANFTCREGHEGRKCAGCVEDYGHVGPLCVPCVFNILTFLGLVLYLTGVVVYAIFFRSPPEDCPPLSSDHYAFRSPGPFGLVLQWIQYVALMLMSFRFPNITNTVESILRFSHGASGVGTAADCYISPFSSFVVAVLSPVAACALGLTSFFVFKVRRIAMPWAHAVSVALFLLDYVYLPVITNTLSFVLCEYDEGLDQYFYIRYPDLECGTVVPYSASLAMTVVYGVVLLIIKSVTVYVLRYKDLLDNPYMVTCFGSMYLSYRKRMLFMHSLGMALRLVVIVCLTLRGIATCVAIAAVTLWIGFVGSVRPYATTALNVIDIMCFTSLAMVQTYGLLSEVMKGDEAILGFVITTLGCLLLPLVVFLLRTGIEDHRRASLAKSVTLMPTTVQLPSPKSPPTSHEPIELISS